MKLFFHYCPSGFSNCYVLASDANPKGRSASPNTPPPEAIIIDPGIMDAEILNLIEENNFDLRGVFITHDHPHHVSGVKTIKKIYDTEIYAINPVIAEHRTTLIRNGDIIKIGQLEIEVISVPGHSADSAALKAGRLLFTGDALSAGLVGSTASSYAAMTQATTIRSRLLSLPGDYTILPGHGPPSSMEAERRFNYGLLSVELRKNRRPAFRYEN